MGTDTGAGMKELLEIMARLRDQEDGCPWDIEQNFATIAPYTIEEAYEVADAVDRGDLDALKDELGDLLLQVVYHAQMAREQGAFGFSEVVRAICDKMIRRHPHVFGDESVTDAAAQTVRWEQHKAAERDNATGIGNGESEAAGVTGALDGVPIGLPALTRAVKLQKRAARVGFDWPEASQALAKLDEERAELAHEMATGAEADRLEDEMGDLLFVCVNVARKLHLDPEKALRRANNKFERRFRRVEAMLAEDGGRNPSEADLDELEKLWGLAKAHE
ncbi:MAG: nucleoside triphosphate pyrophosphohydrolase [Rhodospirillales bacterium]|nr:nucleoside triphosphate pyrophosphohydrolase [Rhodospirillales bacterium]